MTIAIPLYFNPLLLNLINSIVGFKNFAYFLK